MTISTFGEKAFAKIQRLHIHVEKTLNPGEQGMFST